MKKLNSQLQNLDAFLNLPFSFFLKKSSKLAFQASVPSNFQKVACIALHHLKKRKGKCVARCCQTYFGWIALCQLFNVIYRQFGRTGAIFLNSQIKILTNFTSTNGIVEKLLVFSLFGRLRVPSKSRVVFLALTSCNLLRLLRLQNCESQDQFYKTFVHENTRYRKKINVLLDS